MTELIGRAAERSELELSMAKAIDGQPQLLVLFGRRRVGKTYLLRRVLDAAATPTIYFAALRGRPNDEAARFAAEASRVLSTAISGDWSEVFRSLVAVARTKPVVVAIDEAPYLIDEDASWTSSLQHAWDEAQSSGPCHLWFCLTGSAVTTLTNVISSGGPLFGRSTKLLRLNPFDLPMCHQLLGEGTNPRTSIEALAACGGYPLLLRQWDTSISAQSNIFELAGKPLGPLATDANALLLDLPDPTGYRRVLSSIGRRRSKRNEINSELGQRADRALSVLEQTGLIQRTQPIDDRSPKSLTYRLDDHYLSFWFLLVDPNQQEIDSGQGAAALRRRLEVWNHHVEAVFEHEAREHAVRLVNSGGLPTGVVGRWWTDRPKQAELDVVIADDRWNVIGEAKFKDRFGITDWRKFTANMEVAGPKASGARRALWVRESVDDAVLAFDPELLLYRPADMMYH